MTSSGGPRIKGVPCRGKFIVSLYGSDNSALSSINIHSDHIFVMQFLRGNFCNIL